jgi:hypothetical protein
LTDRLQTLVDNQILERRLYQDNPPRYEYVLTERGEDLFPILMTVMAWGDKWLNQGAVPTELVHLDCGKVTKPRLCCSKCGKELRRRTVRARPGPGSSSEYWEAIRKAREAAKVNA